MLPLRSILLLAACSLPGRLPYLNPRVERPAPVRVELLFTGDVMQHLPQVEAARCGGGFDYDTSLGAVRSLFEGADLVVVNLETTLTRRDRYAGYPQFRSPAALAGALRRAGVDVACLANNHCCDGGGEGMRTTASELDSCGIRRTGVFIDSADYKKNNPLYLTCRGIRFALLDYTYGTNGLPVPAGTLVNRIDTVQMARDLAAAAEAGVDCKVVSIHWGDEYARQPNASQRALAAFLRRHGADLIVGSHPHVVQPWEADSAHVVLYSLGNFVSNQRRRYTDGGLVARIGAAKHPDGRMTYSLETIPVWVRLPDYRVLPPAAADTAPLPAAYRLFRDDMDRLTGTAL
ncbi:CapA family protein [Alistipes sp.]|uniref:CapA family protein n=1 Tax=Alistipes sp. TaxID=1872444 RepID=UPI003AEF8B97